MKKIIIFTWLHNGNYGSLLQAVALQKFLTDNGYNVTDLDYSASLKTKLINWWQNKNSPILFLTKLNEVKSKRAYPHPELFDEREKLFDTFRHEKLKLTPLCQSPKDVKEAIKDFDVFICGSDQIWSPALMNPVYFLESVPENKTKIAYAPSFGISKTTMRKKKQMARYLRRFDYLSVRETQGQDLVRELVGQNVPVRIDPTMLITKSQWASYVETPLESGAYIFCYLLTPNPNYEEAVRRFAWSKNLPVILVPTAKGPFGTGFDERISVGPVEWLNYIAHAAFVCTDSFHGCIFSAIFEKEFILFKRFSDNDRNSENSRVYTLSKLLGTEDHLLGEDDLENLAQLPSLDYAQIRSVIEAESQQSADWLLDIMKKECNRK